MTRTPFPASESLTQRYTNLLLPADAAALALLCADTLEALRVAEAEVGRLQTAVGRNRRIGIALGIIMAIERVNEAGAERLLSRRGAALRTPLRLMAERIICGPTLTQRPSAGEPSLAAVTPSTRRVPSRPLRTTRT